MKFSKLFLFVILLYATSSCGQDYQTKSQLEHEIIGEWIHEDDEKTKITFNAGGVMKRFSKNELQSTGNYEITTTCNGEELEEGLFLKVLHQEDNYSCSYIGGINYNKNGIFSFMTAQQGKIVVYKREGL